MSPAHNQWFGVVVQAKPLSEEGVFAHAMSCKRAVMKTSAEYSLATAVGRLTLRTYSQVVLADIGIFFLEATELKSRIASYFLPAARLWLKEGRAEPAFQPFRIFPTASGRHIARRRSR